MTGLMQSASVYLSDFMFLFAFIYEYRQTDKYKHETLSKSCMYLWLLLSIQSVCVGHSSTNELLTAILQQTEQCLINVSSQGNHFGVRQMIIFRFIGGLAVISTNKLKKKKLQVNIHVISQPRGVLTENPVNESVCLQTAVKSQLA